MIELQDFMDVWSPDTLAEGDACTKDRVCGWDRFAEGARYSNDLAQGALRIESNDLSQGALRLNEEVIDACMDAGTYTYNRGAAEYGFARSQVLLDAQDCIDAFTDVSGGEVPRAD